MNFQPEEGKLISFIVAAGEGNRSAEDYLHKVKKLSVKAVRRLKNDGVVRLNGKNTMLRQVVRDGDTIEIIYPKEEVSPYLLPEFVPLDIVYEDDNILIVNKQAGICVHPTKGYPGQTLANGVLYHWAENQRNYRVHLVNRLDKDTSGLVLIAKHTYEAQQLFAGQQRGGIKRAYLALVVGVVPEEEGLLDWPIAREEGRTTKRFVAAHGQRALTYYKVRERFCHNTLLEITLETGRTHQIRVHLSHFGFPVVGDVFYGEGASEDKLDFLPGRQFLHAYYMSFSHPCSQQRMEFTLALPEELDSVIRSLRT